MIAKTKLSIASAIVLSLIGSPMALAQLEPNDDPPVETIGPGALRDLMVQFRVAPSFRLVARVEYAVDPRPEIIVCSLTLQERSYGIPIAGWFRFKASDARYWCSSVVDPEHVPGMQTQVAFNGTQSQILMSDKTLIRRTGDIGGSILPLLPNPLLQLLQFRYPVTDANSDIELRMQDVWNDQIPESFWDVPWTSVNDNGLISERADFPGGVHEGRTYVHRVVAPVDRRQIPSRIERIDDAARLMTSAEFSDYRRVGTAEGHWPHRIVLKAFGEDGILAGQISYTLTVFAVGEALPEEAFVISESLAERIWSDDLSQYIDAGGS